MKKALLFVFFSAWTLWAGAQGMARVAEGLARPESISGARVEVRMDAAVAEAVRNADRSSGRTHIMAYRVRLFSDNSQNARANAYAAAEQFRAEYPGIVVEVSYEVPYFWVTAGSFIDHTEAVALRGKVLGQFSKAVVARQEVPIAAVVDAGKSGSEVENME